MLPIDVTVTCVEVDRQRMLLHRFLDESTANNPEQQQQLQAILKSIQVQSDHDQATAIQHLPPTHRHCIAELY